jgi:very-short-patch-repair endonuclease
VEGAGRRHVVIGQRVSEIKVERARQLRREMTSSERILWHCLRDSQVLNVKFRRQQVIDGFIVDFYCHSAALVVEVDGPSHNGPDSYDEARDLVLAARGLHVLHVTNHDVTDNMPDVLRRIETCIQERTSSRISEPTRTNPLS